MVILWWFNGIYPLVNVYRKRWKDPRCYQWGFIHYFDVIFNSKLLVITRGYCYFLPRFGTVPSGPDFSYVTLDLSDGCAISSSQAALSKWHNSWFSFWFRDATLRPLYLWKIFETLIICNHINQLKPATTEPCRARLGPGSFDAARRLRCLEGCTTGAGSEERPMRPLGKQSPVKWPFEDVWIGKMMGKWWENEGKMMGKWRENDGKMKGKWWENEGKMMGKWRENDGKMKGKWWENEGKMMGKWREHDGKMMGKWSESGGKMMGKWWENDGNMIIQALELDSILRPDLFCMIFGGPVIGSGSTFHLSPNWTRRPQIIFKEFTVSPHFQRIHTLISSEKMGHYYSA